MTTLGQKISANKYLLSIFVVIVVALGYVFLADKSSPSPATESSSAQISIPIPTTSIPISCTDSAEGAPVITSLSSYTVSVGAKLEIAGCNFLGFEADKNAWIENAEGIKGILYGEAGSTDKLIKVSIKSPLCQKDTSYSGLDCDNWLPLTPGSYKINVSPWGKNSNIVDLTIR